MKIYPLKSLDSKNQEKVVSKIKEIFFLCTSVKSFRDQEHKDNFFEKWCGCYLKNYPDSFLIAFFDDKVVGYLSGAHDSIRSLKDLSIPGASVFEDLYETYPAHFHINCHPDSQGKGVGRLLIESFIEQVSRFGLKGTHLITSTDANNLGFYRKLGFEDEYAREYKGMELLMMGRHLLPK